MLFVADARSVAYLNEHPYVLLLDCTYKTNKFDMPLLHVLGVDHHGNSFTIALCFLNQEIAENYTNYTEAVGYLRGLYDPGNWPSVVATDCEPALISAVLTHFPAIQTKCYWHISKCLLAYCKALFDTMERWEEFIKFFKKVVFSKTEDEYEDLLGEFKTEFNWNNGHPHLATLNSSPDEIQDLTTKDLERQALENTLGQWLTPYKLEIVHTWTDRHFHCGTTTTSRLEGLTLSLKGGLEALQRT